MKKILLILLILALCYSVLAFPILPSQFYGTVIIDDNYAKPGTNISIYDNDNLLCGSFTVQNPGEYIISCKGDDLATGKDEGARENENITFFINDNPTAAEAVWHAGAFTSLDLILKTGNQTAWKPVEQPAPKTHFDDTIPLVLIFIAIIIFVIIRLRRLNK